MVTFFGKIETPFADLNTIVGTIRDFARREFKLAVKEFMEAMLSRIPIRTGFLSGSFIKVAKKYGLYHSPIGSHPKPEYFRSGSIKVLKTETSGQQFVTDPEETFKEEGDLFVFEMQSFITYWRINDFGTRIRGAPWLSIDTGRAAFLAYLSTIPNRFPDIKNLLGIAVVLVTDKGLRRQIKEPVKRFIFEGI